jgi:hypothetical protein
MKTNQIIPTTYALFAITLLLFCYTTSYFYDIETSTGNFIKFSWRENLKIVINEVMYDPHGPDTGKEWIELKNTGLQPINISGYELNAASGDYYTFPELIVPPGAFVVVHWRKSGTDDTDFSNNVAHLYTGTTGFSNNMGNTNGWVALFNSSTHSSSTIIDYVEYGSGDQTWENAAVAAGIWQEDDFIPDVDQGHSIARYSPGYDNDLSSDFYDEDTPTPGSENNQ